MRFGDLLHAQLLGELAALGHTDYFVIADAGLPIPRDVLKIDLAVCPGIPSFMQLCQLTIQRLPVEAITIAEEMQTANQQLYQDLQQQLPQWEKQQNQSIACHSTSHEMLKQLCHSARFIVRSGEFSPFANMIIHAGVAF